SGGTVSGTLACRGPWERATAQADLTLASLRIGSEPLDRVSVQVTAKLPQWSGQLKVTHATNETVTVDAAGENISRVELTIDSTPLDLANWRGAGRRRLKGTLAVHGRLSGPPSQLDGFVEVRGSGLGMRWREIGDVLARAEGSRGEWRVTGRALDGTV